MVAIDLIRYITTERDKKTSDESIRRNLLSTGWNEKDIAEAMASVPQAQNVMGSLQYTPEFTKFKSGRTWLIFSLLLILPVGFLLMLLENNPLIKTFYFPSLIVAAILMYIASAVATIGTHPRDARWKEVLEFLGRLIAGFIVFGILFLIAFFIAGQFIPNEVLWLYLGI